MFKETDSQKLENAKKLKDYLWKKSPNVFKGWQKRYFIIANDGRQLAWFKKDEIGAKPKGSINIREIKDISSEGSKILNLTFGDRKFVLKAENAEVLEIWKNAITILRTFWNEEKNRAAEGEESDSMNSSRISKGSKAQWKMKNIDQETIKGIISEKEKILAEQTNLTKNIDNRIVMQEKGIYQYLQCIKPEEMLKRRLIAGFLDKRSKGKMKYFQRRWFILISAKPLFDNDQDEEILQENKLPPWMELDTLYYFRYKDEKDSSGKKGEIKMKDCLDIKEKDMSKSKEKGWAFRINIGDRLFHVLTDIETERAKWNQALRNSMKTAHEMSKKKGIKKNIDNIVAIYDCGKTNEEKSKNLRGKIDSDIQKMKERILGTNKISTYDALTSLLDPMNSELIDILNACLAKEPKRTDIIKEYIDYYHEKICEELTAFWDVYHDEMGNLTYLSICKWLNNYAESISTFFVDERISSAIKQLLKTYFEKTAITSEVIIDGIIDFARKTSPQKDDENLLYSSSPYDLFKIINEIFDLSYKLCPLRETALKLASFSKKILTSYHSKSQELLDEEAVSLDVNKFICVCNNTITLCNLIKSFNQRLLDECKLKPEDTEKNFDPSNLIKLMNSLGKQARDLVFNMLFAHYNQFFTKTNFLNIKLDKILSEVEKQKEAIDMIHESFSRKIWKSFLEKIVILYFQTLIMSCNKANKDDADKMISKLESDEQYLFNQFDGLLFTNTVKLTMKPFSDIIPFLDDTSLFSIQQSCKNLRSVFGPAFNEKTVKAIFNLRFDLDNGTKNDIIEACKDTLNIYNKENLEKEKNDVEHGRIYDLFEEGINLDDDDDIEEREKKEKAKAEEQNRRKSIKLDDIEAPSQTEITEEAKVEKVKDIQEEKFSGEGFLYKKPPRKYKLKWEKRYFRIKNGVLYWYLNERSRESQNKIKLIEVEEIYPHPKPDKNKKFKIKVSSNGKVYKFMAETPKDRYLWIKSLKEEIMKCKNQMEEKDDITQLQISKGGDKPPLFKDYFAIKNAEKITVKMENQLAQQKNVKNKIQNIKAKLLVQKMQNNMMAMDEEKKAKGKTNTFLKKATMREMNNPSQPKMTASLETDASEMLMAPRNNDSCWKKFLDCLGLADIPENERFIKQ